MISDIPGYNNLPDDTTIYQGNHHYYGDILIFHTKGKFTYEQLCSIKKKYNGTFICESILANKENHFYHIKPNWAEYFIPESD